MRQVLEHAIEGRKQNARNQLRGRKPRQLNSCTSPPSLQTVEACAPDPTMPLYTVRSSWSVTSGRTKEPWYSMM